MESRKDVSINEVTKAVRKLLEPIAESLGIEMHEMSLEDTMQRITKEIDLLNHIMWWSQNVMDDIRHDELADWLKNPSFDTDKHNPSTLQKRVDYVRWSIMDARGETQDGYKE